MADHPRADAAFTTGYEEPLMVAQWPLRYYRHILSVGAADSIGPPNDTCNQIVLLDRCPTAHRRAPMRAECQQDSETRSLASHGRAPATLPARSADPSSLRRASSLRGIRTDSFRRIPVSSPCRTFVPPSGTAWVGW